MIKYGHSYDCILKYTNDQIKYFYDSLVCNNSWDDIKELTVISHAVRANQRSLGKLEKGLYKIASGYKDGENPKGSFAELESLLPTTSKRIIK